MNPFLRISILALLGSTCLGLTACSICSFPPRIYRIDVRQGNLINPDAVQKLRVGMTKLEVQDLMGTPALTHFLNKDRWDYYYYLKPGNGDPIVETQFTVFFKNDRVINWSC